MNPVYQLHKDQFTFTRFKQLAQWASIPATGQRSACLLQQTAPLLFYISGNKWQNVTLILPSLDLLLYFGEIALYC